jgi:hypothetical protein
MEPKLKETNLQFVLKTERIESPSRKLSKPFFADIFWPYEILDDHTNGKPIIITFIEQKYFDDEKIKVQNLCDQWCFELAALNRFIFTYR